MKDKKKVHWLKIDFNRWRDEDDSEPEDGGEPEQDLDEVSRCSVVLKKILSSSSLKFNPMGFLIKRKLLQNQSSNHLFL